jgi:hypothetical protein
MRRANRINEPDEMNSFSLPFCAARAQFIKRMNFRLRQSALCSQTPDETVKQSAHANI